ncbi:hypothetical protein N7532_000079 [Penicillium argentinense]|uniref:Uncharacterized protein n=1 Tax=Penicillium argentinense TaxID=1131581 RepID=A0A9W9KMA4_9EURO|nr:uncharacterized protein N7532_000079 [Penicillium argentinense]KAJ5112034.1 hypothetical protein N7532_000079 [Penicillium argentinense]
MAQGHQGICYDMETADLTPLCRVRNYSAWEDPAMDKCVKQVKDTSFDYTVNQAKDYPSRPALDISQLTEHNRRVVAYLEYKGRVDLYNTTIPVQFPMAEVHSEDENEADAAHGGLEMASWASFI